ncbi:Subunit of both RNase MRP and nuclear RNase P [Babesia ovata]|uniref:Subunit of both RNase MRP and nuclear RNase P n=1 Tax=Babesia ovata TaxID=189622 RepID=A0A2H6KI58_9APIC|nr:Subunit of both RNase MRP and nuclear RNase P [Babesia ovata]GBE62661.1 Subunit of both RNase MRP and nuclear RNase P [Babesia ovata]
MIDLNVPWTAASDASTWLSAAQLRGWSSLGFNVYCRADKTSVQDIPLNLPSCDLKVPEHGTEGKIVTTLGRQSPGSATFIRRVTIMLNDGFQPNSFNKIAEGRDYDVVAVMPTTQKTFQTACETLNCDLINLDYFCHYATFKVKRGMVTAALHRGCYFEVTMATMDHLGHQDEVMSVDVKDRARIFRAHFTSVLHYIPLKRLVLSPGNLDPTNVVDPPTFIGMCSELISSATGEPCDASACITAAPKGCIAKGAARRTYGTGILVHMADEPLGKRFTSLNPS